MEYDYTSHSEEDTLRLATRVAQALDAGAVVALYGELGAGKTVFVRGLATGLGVGENVVSPTFTLMREYAGRLRLFHFDAYRIGDESELEETGLDEALGGEGVAVVEWAEKAAGLLPEERIDIRIQRAQDERARDIRIACGEKYAQALKAALLW